MKKRISSALVAPLAGLILASAFPVVSQSASSAGATLGPLWTAGTCYAGGTNLYYRLNVTANTPGALTLESHIKGKGWKAALASSTTLLDEGTNLVNSGAVTVPAGFTGDALLKVTARFNGRKVGSRSIMMAITAAPSPAPAAPQTTLYDVGFGNPVTLNANVASTNGLGPITSYTWTQTSGPSVTLSNATTATPSFTSLGITNFFVWPVDQGNGTFVYTNALPDGQTGPLAFSAEQQDDSTYGFKVVISDGTNSATGTVSVVSASINRGQNSAPLGVRQYFIAPTNLWKWALMGAPSNSTAVLENPTTRTPSFRPDKEGEYTIYCYTVTAGVTNTTTVIEKGATYVGVSTCASCHGPNSLVGLTDIYTPWSQTLHSTMAQRGVDGILSSHYKETCFKCHTLGNDKGEEFNGFHNNGFDDVQAALGWTFPTVLQTGNYASMPAALQNKANIQCESCHGPGSQHPGAGSKSLDEKVCASCHEEAPNHVHPAEWELSPHADAYASIEPATPPANNSGCAKCHSPFGFVDTQESLSPIRTGVGQLSCQACHDPHNVKMFPADAHQVRIYDTVSLDSGVTLTGKGASALCMNCHNQRRVAANFMTSSLPHNSSATDVLLGINGITNVVLNGTNVWNGTTNTFSNVTNLITTANSPHSTVANCIDCHMYNTGSTTVGVHTFSMTDRITGEDNLAACNQCHAGVDPVTDFDHVSQNAQDYDGDGTVAGIQTEVQGLLNIVSNKLASTGLTVSDGNVTSSSFSTNTVLKTAQRAAAWNYVLIAHDGGPVAGHRSLGVHNSRYTVELLQWSYSLLGQVTDGHSFSQDYPSAYLW